MPVDSTHQDYKEHLDIWKMCQDFCIGTRAVKKKAEKYLPRPNPNDKSKNANERYKNYLARTAFYGYSKKIVNQYLGLAFKENPICELPSELDYLKKNANGAGLSIYQIAQKGFKHLMVQGRFGLWVDYPVIDAETRKNLSVNDMAKINIKPTILFYDTFSIVNWRVGTVNNETVPTLIVLKEQISDTTDDRFVEKAITQYRELGIDEVGYYVAVWREVEKVWTQQSKVYPTNNKNQVWQKIPFMIFGSQYNSFEIQDIPIEPLVDIEKGIYCNSADAENSRFLCGQTQPFMNVDSQTADYYNQKDENGNLVNEVTLGSETVIMLGEHGTFGFAQASPNTMATEGIKEKREIIAELGYQLGQAGSGIKTATQAENEQVAQHSQASLCVANLNEGFFNVLLWCNQYLGLNQEPKFIIRQSFSQRQIDIGLLTALNVLVDGGKLPKTVIFDKSREWNLLDSELSDDDIFGMIEAQSPINE